MRWLWVAVVAVVIAGSGAAIAFSASGGLSTSARTATTAVPTVSTAGFPTGQATGIFTDRCAFSHEAADDPILAPGKTGQSMHHDFFGNTGTNAHSTTSSLVGGATSCSTTADSSAYWAPVLYQDGKPLTPKTSLIYWRQDSALATSVATVPAGLTMIAGNESATAPQPTSVISWTCFGGSAQRKDVTSVPHDCADGQTIRLTVHFPSCWDGHTLNGSTQTNVVYPVNDSCPTDHPVVIPQIVFHTEYPTASAAQITLSMTPTMQGSADTEHVDFMNGWNQADLGADVKACISTSTKCGPATGPSATPQGGKNGKSLGTGARPRGTKMHHGKRNGVKQSHASGSNAVPSTTSS